MNSRSASHDLALGSLNKIESAAGLVRPCCSLALRSTLVFKTTLIVIGVLLCGLTPNSAHAQTFGCSPAMANDIVCENSKVGSPAANWDISGAGDSTIQGFATDISVNQGQTISFKINTDAKAYTITIFRLGYYVGGTGARQITSVSPSVTLPQVQPACKTDAATLLYDCGNWAVSASWQVPSNATSGIYVALLKRTDTGGVSHIVFVVRNDASHSDVLFQAADESWQAYNAYGGNSVYGGLDTFDLNNRAYKVSYNRPFITRGFGNETATWLFGNEYPMIRWLEQNGYDVTYSTGVDSARNGSLILNHKMFMDCGHDEYWSGPQRTNVEAARNAGVNMAFFSGNEVFWKTRWENSIDGSNTPYRTMVVYKETLAFAKIDPTSTWTGTWRDPSFSPPSDGGRPENSLTGTLFMVNGTGTDNAGNQSIQVPAADGKMRFWRNTTIANLGAGQTSILPAGTLGYEWDADVDNGFRPAGLFDLSTATYSLTVDYLLDYGATYGAGTATHRMTSYRAPSGALVFGAGTVQYAWGLDSNHDNTFSFSTPAASPDMQQATVNLFADMGVQPATLQGGLLLAQKSTDTTPPISTITSPATGTIVARGTPVTVTGTATDSGGGVVAGVEVSSNGGQTWHPAIGRQSWTFTFTPLVSGPFHILSRAVDDTGNLETPGAGVTVSVPLPPAGIDSQASGDSTTPSNNVQTSSFSTSTGNELLLAFIAADYTVGANTTVTSVSGGGLTWVLVVRTNTQSGTSEIWRAFTSSVLSNVTVTATLSQSAIASITVATFTGVDITGTNGSGAIGATKSASGPTGAPTASLVTTRPNSWVLGVGNDFDRAVARTVGSGQKLLHQDLTPSGDTYWVQMLSNQVASSGTTATVNDTAPTNDQYNLSIVEVLSPVGGSLFSISGTVSPSSIGNGTLLTLSGPASAAVAADSSGNFSFGNLGNGTYTVTPSKGGFTFNPSVQTVTISGGNVTGVNFTGSAVPTYSISGTVTPSSIGSGTTLTLSGASNASLTGDASGNFSFTGLVNGTYTVTPSKAGFIFSPLNQTVTINSANATAVNFTGSVIPTFTVSGNVSPATAGSGTVLTLSGASTATVTADSSGNFSFAGLQNGTYTITPSKTLVSFTPVSQTLTVNGGNVTGVNFAATTGELLFATQTPAVTNASDGVGVDYELGTVFTARVAGQITAIRFWKASSESGTHTGHLWNSAGQLLATVTFSGETASGWQQQDLAAPVTIAANANYVVSVNTANSFYVDTASGLASSVVNGDLSTPVGSNGVYATPGVFPTSSFQNSNYFRDVLFIPSATYSASGTVSPAASSTGTTLTLSGAGTGTVTADASGNYTFSGLANGSYTVTPTKPGFTFNPASLTFSVSGTNVTALNFTTNTLTYTLSGVITPTTAGSAATVSLTGTTTGTVTADSSGNYAFTGLPNGTYTVTPGKSGYAFAPASQAVTINGSNALNVNFTGATGEMIFSTQTPVVTNGSDGANVNYELGTVFTSRVAGQIMAIRFWKASSESGTHTGHLWNSAGQLLATVTFTGETASGWQQQNLTTPIAITANANYVVSVNTANSFYVDTASGLASSVVNGDLSTPVGSNGVYGTPGAYPTGSFQNSNYFRDVLFVPVATYSASGTVSPAASGAGTTLTLSGAGTGTTTADASGNYTFAGLANGSYTITPSKAGFVFNPTSVTFSVSGTNVTGLSFATTTLTYNMSGTITPATAGSGATVSLTGTTTATVTADTSGNFTFSGLPNGSYTVTPAKAGYAFTPASQAVTISGSNVLNVNFTGAVGEMIFSTQTPAVTNASDGANVNYELGTVFTSAVAGQITAIRFWKASNESGTHTGHLWSATGQLLATVTFTGETTSGWQQQNLATPVAITANTNYVVSVNTASTYYVATNSGLAASVINGDLKTPVGNNGVYGTSGAFPTNSYQNSNYFRDVVFTHP